MLTRGIRQGISLVALCTVACFAASPGSGQRAAVSREQIANALQSAGFDTTATQLQLLSTVTSMAGARLRVAKVKTESAGTALAELNCEERRCLPFYVLVHDTDFTKDEAIAALRVTRGCPAKEHPLLPRGKPVTLLIENANLRIVLPAISLEGGMQGQIIKVTSPDRKRVYRAEVVNNTTVRSTL